MLRIELLQQWYALGDPAMEQALHEIPTLRRFAKLGGLDSVPDATTIVHVRRLLETHGLAARMLAEVNAQLARKGQRLRPDVTVTHALLHGTEDSVFGDNGDTGADKREELQACEAALFIAAKHATSRAIGNKRARTREKHWEHVKASVRAKVEHPFCVIKRQFGDTNVRYRGLAKTAAQVLTLFALPTLWVVRRQLLPARG